MFKIELQWKEFNINLSSVNDKLHQDYASFLGNQATPSCWELYFESEPSQAEKDALQAYWDGLSAESDEAEDYQSAAQLESDRLVKIASGKAKLLALGLTADEVKAILG